MADKPSMLFHSNAPWTGTGYGQQTALFAKRLAEHYKLTISAFYGLEGSILPWNGIPVLPAVAQTYGNETIAEHTQMAWGDDPRKGIVLTLMDVWVLDPLIWRNLNTACWVPVDHQPVPEPVERFFYNSAAIPIAMSRFGEQELRNCDPLYVPHAVDTKVYRPYDQAEAREETGMPKDAFIVGMVAANKGNPSRKCFEEAFKAFKVFHARHPEARLYLHTELTGRFGGVNLPKLLDAVRMPRDACIFTDQYRAVHFPFPGDVMARVYSSLDVLCSASAGEGFGIPVIEAQACGTPVIVSDFSAQPELVGAGSKVEGTKTFTPIGSWQFRPNVEDMVESLEAAYRNRENPSVPKKARTKALEYDVDTVMEKYMLPVLEQVAERYEDRKPMELAA